MKTNELVREITRAGWKLHRRAKDHDIYTREGSSQRITMPRHRMVERRLAKYILVQMSY